MKNTHKIVASLAGVVLLLAAVIMVVVSFRAFSQIKEAAEARKLTYSHSAPLFEGLQAIRRYAE